MFWRNNKILFFVFFFFLNSCTHKRVEIYKSLSELNRISISIDMPKNVLVFRNISPILYTALHHHFRGVGFNVCYCCDADFTLKTEVKKLDKFGKIVSPDILSYGFTIKLVVLVKLFDNNYKLIKEKEFEATYSFFKPSDPIFSSDFHHRAHQVLSKRMAIKIEQYLRSIIFKRQT